MNTVTASGPSQVSLSVPVPGLPSSHVEGEAPSVRPAERAATAVAAAVSDSFIQGAGVAASTVSHLPAAAVTAYRKVWEGSHSLPARLAISAVLPPVLLAAPVALGVVAATAGLVHGLRHGADTGVAASARGALDTLTRYHEQFVPNLLSTVEQYGRPLPLSDAPKRDPRTRFGVIGAGPAGLAAARRLVAKGYDVTILEKAPEAGGKVHSVDIDGQTYEMGAVVAVPAYASVKQMAREVGVAERPAPSHSYFGLDGTGRPVDPLTLGEKLRLPIEAGRWIWKNFTDWNGTRESYAQAPAELNQPMEKLMEREGMSALSKAMKPTATALGYGYFEEVPAAYWTRYYPPEIVFPGGPWNTWEGGYQEVMKRTAALPGHKLVTNASITGVERGDTVKVHTSQGDYEFDELVVATPPAATLSFLDATPEEKGLLGQVKTYDYRVYVCEAEGLPGTISYIPENLEPGRKGHPVCWYKHNQDTSLYTFYVIADPKMSDQDVTRILEGDVEKLHGKLKSVRASARWDYFPHVDQKSLDQGFYSQFDALQGQNHTTYVGELFNFSTVNCTVENAQRAMERF